MSQPPSETHRKFIWRVNLEEALERGFEIAFAPALVGSLVSQLPSWLNSPFSWETVRMPFQIVAGCVALSALTSLVVGILVFLKRAYVASVSEGP
jgi:uncharacterized membrane protein